MGKLLEKNDMKMVTFTKTRSNKQKINDLYKQTGQNAVNCKLFFYFT